MKSTEILETEHRVIEQVLNCLAKMVVKFESEGKVDAESARDAVDFFRNFADKCHHGKEETHLFPKFERANAEGHCNPISVMLYEHDEGRAHVRGMDESIEAASKGDPDALKKWATHAKGFIMLLRSHIEKEDTVLYPMANMMFTNDDQNELLGLFDRVETEEMKVGTHEKYLGIANKLADCFGVKKVAESEHTCCGH